MSQYNNNNNNNNQVAQRQQQYAVVQSKYQQNYGFEIEQINENYSDVLYWGVRTEGIQSGDRIHGIILGMPLHEQSKGNGQKHLVLKCFEENGVAVTVYACKELNKNLHGEQDYPFINLKYQIGDAVQVVFRGFSKVKINGEERIYAKYSVNKIKNYELTEQDVNDIKNYQRELSKKTPISEYKTYQNAPVQQQYASHQGQQFQNNQPRQIPQPQQQLPQQFQQNTQQRQFTNHAQPVFSSAQQQQSSAQNNTQQSNGFSDLDI